MHEGDILPQNTYPQLYPDNLLGRDLTQANFDWNQLSRNSIGFSPLYPDHANQQMRNRFGPPRGFTLASACPGIDHPVSGNFPKTKGAVNTLALKTCGDSLSLRLSSRLRKKLPGPLFRTYDATPKSRIILSLICFRSFHIPFKNTFQRSLTVLVRYRSCVIFRFGGQCPPYSCLISNRHYSGYLKEPSYEHLRDFHPLRLNFQEHLTN